MCRYARVDLVRDARGDNGEDRGGALTTGVEPGEKPVLSAEHEPAELTFEAVVGELDVSVVEEKQEAMPLAVKIAKSSSERRSGRDALALLVEEAAEVFDDGFALFESSQSPLFCRVSSELRFAFDGEERRHLTQRRERDLVASSSGLGEVAPRMSPAARALAASAFEEVGDAGPVALHGATHVAPSC